MAYVDDVQADSPKIYWRVGEASGNAVDWSAFLHTGAVTGTTRAVAGAIRDPDKAIRFGGGVTERISVTSDIDFDFEQTEPFTIECWARFAVPASPMVLWAKCKDASPTRGYTGYVNTDGTIHVQLINTVVGNLFLEVQTDTPWSDNRWHHIVTTYDGSGSAAGIFVYVGTTWRTRSGWLWA